MTIRMDEQPLVVLVDDDTHSARLLVRTFSHFGNPQIKWHGDAGRSLRLLTDDFAGAAHTWPALIVVDLKHNSHASADFIRHAIQLLPNPSIPIVAIAASLEREARDDLLGAGATAVFQRHAGIAAYQNEVAAILAFLDRHRAEHRRHQARHQGNPGAGIEEVAANDDPDAAAERNGTH